MILAGLLLGPGLAVFYICEEKRESLSLLLGDTLKRRGSKVEQQSGEIL